MRINYKQVILGSSLIIGGAVKGIHDFSRELDKGLIQVKESVRTYNPKRYYQIVNSKDSANYEVWGKALQEVNDSIAKLNEETIGKFHTITKDTFVSSTKK